MTTFPDDYDSDIEIQRIDENVSEVSGDVINSLRDAIFAIQRVVGLSPQGNKSSFGDRVNVSIDANGNIKASSLDRIGLLTLPVVNSHIGVTAGVEESKLALDYGTTYLKALISSLQTDVGGISSGLSASTATSNIHYLGTGNFHDGYHVKVNVGSTTGIAGLEATTVGDALNEIGALLISGDDERIAHINTDIPSNVKHTASEISVDATDFTTIDRTSADVQAALDSLDAESGALGVAHVDKFHSNGILKEVNSGTHYNPRRKLLSTTTGASYTEGTSVIKIPDVTSFADISVVSGDILEIAVQSGIVDSGKYQIRAIGPLTDSATLGDLPTLDVDELAIFHVFTESRAVGDGVGVTIYKPATSSSEFAPLSCVARNNETTLDTISVLNPDSARVISVGFNGTIVNTDGYEVAVRVGLGNQSYRELVIPNLNRERLGTNQANPVDSTSVAERINAYVSDPDIGVNFPITAYRIGNELVIAHNLSGVDYTVEILDGYSGNFALGLDAYGANITGVETVGSEYNTYSVNGTALNTLKTAFDGYASISSDSSTFMLWTTDEQMINPLRYGIGSGSVMHVMNHPSLNTNGSYTLLSANSTSVSLFSGEEIDAPTSSTTFNVSFTSSNVQLSFLENSETSMGLVQILVDTNGGTFAHQRLIYGTNLGSAIEITNVSGAFPVENIMLLVGRDGNFVDFNIIDDTIPGETVRIHEDFKGSFKLYHSNGIDYLTIHIISGTIPGGLEIVTVNNPVPADEAFLLCTAHFNGYTSITHITDERLFGNMASEQIRDDFVEIFSQRPVSDLRSNGVVRGLDLLDIPYYDSITDMEALPLRGGIAYINGVRTAVETQKAIIPSYDDEGILLNNARRVVGINDFGSIEILSDELGEILTDGYSASVAFGKILPLYQVTIVDGGINEVIDIRRFINNIDEKLDMTVDESNNVVGNFRSLEGALLYAEKYPGNENLTIRIINSVYPQNPLTIPNGVSIIGNTPYGGSSKHQIVNTINHNADFLTFAGNNRLENVEVISSTSGLQGALVAISGSNVGVEKCQLRFHEAISSSSEDLGIKVDASANVRIVNNRINNVYTGVSSVAGCENLTINDNRIAGVSGVGVSCGIKIGTDTRGVDYIDISNNVISINNTPNTDLRGIFVDVGENIGTLNITGNSVIGALDVNSENYLSNGIRIISASTTGNKVAQLMMFNNYIENVRLHDHSVYGIYIEDVEHAMMSGNTLLNIGVYDASQYSNGANPPTALVWVDDNVDSIEINNNMFTNSNAQRGIYINSTSTTTSIIGNTLANVGDLYARYIYGNAHRANISDNKLVGSGDYGIWWKGERSKISSNHLSASAPTTSYAFTYGIQAQASYVDIVNNTLSDMNKENSTAILNSSTGNEGIKILGNTIEGTKMAKLINLFGNYHVISGNRLKNDVKSTTEDSIYINLGTTGSPDGVSILGNVFEGAGSACVYSTNAVTNASINNNVVLTTSLTMAPFKLTSTSVADCMVMGNKLPARTTYSEENTIGLTPSYLVYNNNTIGVNRGMLDTRGVHASAGVTAYDSSGAADYSEFPHWTFNDDGNYWEVNSVTSSDPRYLYFPLPELPNGATLTSAELQGKNVLQSGDTFEAQIWKRSVKASGLTVSAVSDAKDMSSASGEFGNTSDVGLMDESSGSDLAEIINYEESNYYVRIKHAKASPSSPTDIRIYGMTVSFRY